MFANVIANILKMLIHSIVAISQHADTQLSKLGISLGVFLSVRWLTVLHTVNFDGDAFFCNEKIKDVVTNGFLTVYSKRQVLQKIIPKMLFFRGHIFSECLRGPGKRRIVFVAHLTPQIRRPRQGIGR